MVLKVHKIIGNIFDNADLAKEFDSGKDDCHKTIFLSRHDMEKTRLKQKTADGIDIGIDIQDGKTLKHGDVLSGDEIKILVRQTPELVITAKIAKLDSSSLVLLGHMIGNLHRPVSVMEGSIAFPIHKESEIELFRTMFGDITHKIDLTVEEKIFEPHKSMNVHEH